MSNVRITIETGMQRVSSSGPLRLCCAANGVVYGVGIDGRIGRFRRSSVRAFAVTHHRAGDFDECDVEVLFQPTPAPPFSIAEVSVSDSGRSLLLKGELPSAFGVIRLDTRRYGDDEEVFEVPFYQPLKLEDVDVQCVRLFPGDTETLCILKADATLEFYDTEKPLFPERVYRLRRYDTAPLGISNARHALPVDIGFAPSLPWGLFIVFVLYEDGGLFALCPVFPLGAKMEEHLLKAAGRCAISRNLLKTLLTECVSRGSEFEVQLVPAMQGPINDGLLSEWEADFAETHCDQAVCLSCASYEKRCTTLTIGTAYGVLYSHALIEDIKPEIVPPSAAMVTSMGARICPLKETVAKLHLVEMVELQKKSKKKMTVHLWQDSRHPELMYCQWGSDVLRLRFGWIACVLFGDTLDSEMENCEVWKFKHSTQFLGSFHDLDASIAVFQHGHRTSASIFRSNFLNKSSVKVLTPSYSSADDSSDEEEAGQVLSEIEAPGFDPLKKAYQRYEYMKLENPSLDLSLDKLSDDSAQLEELTSDLEHRFASFKGQTPQSLDTLKEFVCRPWADQAIRDAFENMRARLDEVRVNPPHRPNPRR